jgi:O-antigen ligase
MTKMTDAAVPAPSGAHVAGRAHDILLVALIALRPLIWSGQASAWDNLAWLLLVLVALLWLVIDAWRGRVRTWRFGVGGILGAALLLILLPAALRSPYPSTGMGLWGMAVIHLGFAAYLMQVIRGRERLAFAALMGALVVECLVALGQWAWVLPKMAAALAGGDPAIAALENANGDLANRVAYGGLFGTFTLANTLAAFLLLAAVPFLGVLTTGQGRQRIVAAVVIVLSASVAIGTASKGAAVALAVAGALVWTLHITGRRRWLAVTVLVVGAIAVAGIPHLQGLGEASAKVRLGYWQGATGLIAERPVIGHGIDGFAAHGTRTMPLDAEPTRHVHNDVLEATVDGGLLAGVALLALLGWCARRRPATTIAAITGPGDLPRQWPAAWPLLLFFPVFSALGMLASNLEWWPLGAGEMTWWLWPLLLSGVAIAIALVGARLPLPPAWAWQLALAAFALHCLVDFNFQSPAIWGTLIVVAVLAGGRVQSVGTCRISRSVVTLLVVALAGGLVFGIQRTVPRTLVAARLAAPVDDALAMRARTSAAVALSTHWPADNNLLLAALRTSPADGRLDLSRDVALRMPWSTEVHETMASELARAGRWDEAVTALRLAVTRNPAYLPRRQRLVDLLTHAASVLPSQAEALLAEAAHERQRIVDLALVVHPRNRLPKPPASGLSVQPAP